MAVWRVEVEGDLRLSRDDVPVRLRTRHQALLLARLVAHGSSGIERRETAALLWPDSRRDVQAAYLRRAVMELRRLGIPIEGEGEKLRLPLGAVDCTPASPETLLANVEHPIAHESRRLLAQTRDLTPKRSDADLLLAWIGDALIHDHPNIAVEMLARHGRDIMIHVAPGPVLALFQRALEASPQPSESRSHLVVMAAQEAMYLTKYGLAERLLRQAVEECEALGNGAQHAQALSMLAFLQMERRSWEEALGNGATAVEVALRSGDRTSLSAAYNNLAGIQWHVLRFEEALLNYERSYAVSLDDERRFRVIGNVALVAGVYGHPLWPMIEAPTGPLTASGSLVLAEANLRVGYGFARNAPGHVVKGASHLLRVASGRGMDRFLCLAFDYAAYAFALLGHREEAAACVRLGSRHRLAVGHHRSPAESLAVRLHVAPPYFCPTVTQALARFEVPEMSRCAGRVANALEAMH